MNILTILEESGIFKKVYKLFRLVIFSNGRMFYSVSETCFRRRFPQEIHIQQICDSERYHVYTVLFKSERKNILKQKMKNDKHKLFFLQESFGIKVYRVHFPMFNTHQCSDFSRNFLRINQSPLCIFRLESVTHFSSVPRASEPTAGLPRVPTSWCFMTSWCSGGIGSCPWCHVYGCFR